MPCQWWWTSLCLSVCMWCHWCLWTISLEWWFPHKLALRISYQIKWNSVFIFIDPSCKKAHKRPILVHNKFWLNSLSSASECLFWRSNYIHLKFSRAQSQKFVFEMGKNGPFFRLYYLKKPLNVEKSRQIWAGVFYILWTNI